MHNEKKQPQKQPLDLKNSYTICYGLPNLDEPFTKIIFAVNFEEARQLFMANKAYQTAHITSISKNDL